MGEYPGQKSKTYQQTMELLRPGAEPTLEPIARHIEVGQIDKFAEFLGQFSCQKLWMLRGLPPSPQFASLSFLRFVRALQAEFHQ